MRPSWWLSGNIILPEEEAARGAEPRVNYGTARKPIYTCCLSVCKVTALSSDSTMTPTLQLLITETQAQRLICYRFPPPCFLDYEGVTRMCP